VDGKTCILGTDCVDLVCAPAPVGTMGSADGGPIDCSGGSNCTCQPPTDTDGVKNDSETAVDCGGGFLNGNATTPNTKSDGAPVCPVGEMCVYGTDCTSGVCNDNAGAGGPPVNCPTGDMCFCQVPSDTDTVQNGGETDVDCGGSTAPGSDGAPACADGKKCGAAIDCVSKVCGTSHTCSAPTPTDGVQNGGETDVDCGGNPTWPAACTPTATADCAPPCADAKMCGADTDCYSAYCTVLTGTTKTCVDGQSCKGLSVPAPIQDVTTLATATTDAIGTADGNGIGQHAGLDTCGAGESTDSPGAQSHESCCKSLLLPPISSCTTNAQCVAPQTCVSGKCSARMDKYEATSGRVRQFLEAVKKADAHGRYNIEGWAAAEVAANTTAGQLMSQMMPTSGATNVVPFLPQGDLVNDGFNGYQNIVAQMGGTVLDAAYPSSEQGCYVGSEAFGGSTYWWPADEESSVGTPPRAFTQDYYDIKPLNCAPYWIAAAFCAWDGGRLPTVTESELIYSTSQAYPWSGSTGQQPVLWANANSEPQATQAESNAVDLATIAGNAGYAITDYTVNWHNANLGSSTGLGDFYFYPSWVLSNPPWAGNIDTLGDGSDTSPYISAPGRFVLDLSAVKSPGSTEGWMDYGANMLEFLEVQSLTAQVAKFCDTTSGVAVGTGCSAAYNCNGGGYCGTLITTFNVPGSLWEGGSWEGHGIQQAGYNEPIFTQYGKAGFRCVRPVEP
jgi:hypothetical protein